MVEIFSEKLNEEFLGSLKKEFSEAFSGCKKIAVKIHFGEPGNETSLTPDKVKPFIGILKELGYEIFLYDSLVAYDSIRNDPVKHREHALSKGYGKLCDIRVNDDFILKKGKYMDYEISKDLIEADGVFVISHVKGHICTGFGGAIKNLGMGAATKNSKVKIHSGGEYKFDKSLCTKCGMCVQKCPMDFIKMGNEGPIFSGCLGCSNCCIHCPTGALTPKLETFDNLLADCAKTAENNFSKVYYLNIIKDISRKCDCDDSPGEIIAKDVGYILGKSAVEIDKKSYNRIVSEQGEVFLENNKKKGDEQIKAFMELSKNA
jgi:uncharacterized protein